jgi:hypothetical protein
MIALLTSADLANLVSSNVGGTIQALQESLQRHLAVQSFFFLLV